MFPTKRAQPWGTYKNGSLNWAFLLPTPFLNICSGLKSLHSGQTPLQKFCQNEVPRRRKYALRMVGTYQEPFKDASQTSAVQSFLPRGTFTLVLHVKLKTYVSIADGKALLAEYARETCAEPSVLRCDVLYEVTKRGIPKGPYYDIWITFDNSHAYMEHERTAHAAKLRIYLDSPRADDTAVVLTKLAHKVSLFRPLRPNADGWRSNLKSDDSNRTQSTSRVVRPTLTDALNSALGKPSPAGTDETRQTLNRLIANVGLENVKILMATAKSTSSDAMRKLRSECEDYLVDLETSPGIVRTGLLVDRNDPLKVILLSVHDPDDYDGASFDMELAAIHLDDDGWLVSVHYGVFPDKIGWERYVDDEEAVRLGLSERTTVSLPPSPLQPESSDLAQTDNSPSNPQYRLLYGSNVFENLKLYVRELAEMPKGEVRIFFVSGWNESRLHPLLPQLEFNRNTDVAPIIFKFGLNVTNCMVTSQNIRLGLKEVRDFDPHIVLGYGGGSVLDAAKFLSRFANYTDAELDSLLGTIDDAVECDMPELVLSLSKRSRCVMLLPTALGPGSETTDACVAFGKTREGIWRHLFVRFDDSLAKNTFQSPSKLVLVDPRLCAPRRYPSLWAGQGALSNTCVAIDVLLSCEGKDKESAKNFAFQAVGHFYANILLALREPETSSGVARDALTKGCMSLGIAFDSLGHIGVSVRLALGIVDVVFDERSPYIFREVMIRVTVAIVERLCSDEFSDIAGSVLREISRTMNVNGKHDIVQMLLRRADICNIPLLPLTGLSKRRIPEIASRLSTHLDQLECNEIEKIFRDKNLVEEVLRSAYAQNYEL